MNARTIVSARSQPARPTPPPRFDAKFIEDHHLIERYLENKLPMRGARDLENWCRAHPEYLEGLKISERAQSSLKLLEASGRPLDLQEPRAPWWHTPYLPIALGVIAALCALALWVLVGKYQLLRGELKDTRIRMHQGSLVQPAVESTERLSPDRAPGIDHARVTMTSSAPQLMDLRIDMSYTKATQFRVTVDKKNQGRALILNNLLKDSNGELRLTLNTTGLAVGTYTARIDALPFHASGSPMPVGWLNLEVH